MMNDEEWEAYCDSFSDDDGFDRKDRFADPYGHSCLFPASESNPRIYPCPTCGEPNRLTERDLAAGYQCDDCADRDEGLKMPI